MAIPKSYEEHEKAHAKNMEISKSALTYKLKPRIKALAVAQEKRGAVSEIKEDAFVISKNALKAKPSARTKELAEPKEYPEIKERSQEISKAALNAKPSERTCELAKELLRRKTEKYVYPVKKP